MDFNPTYRDFFQRAKNERRWILQGSRRSGKTVAIFQILHAAALVGAVRDVLCVNPTTPNLRDLRQVFTEVTGVTTHGTDARGHAGQVGNCWFRFRAFDDPRKAQGTQADVVFYNECNLLDLAMVKTCNLGIRGRQIYDFNPANKFWIDEFITDTNYLRTTWRDNVYLPENQKLEFLEAEARAESPDASIFDKFYRDVYCLGLYGTTNGGLIFPRFNVITQAEYDDIEAREFVGMDFGGEKLTNDPNTIIGTKRKSGALYIHEYCHESGVTNEYLADVIRRQQWRTGATFVYETASGGKERVAEIYSYLKRFTFVPAIKGRILEGLQSIKETYNNEIYITDSSIATMDEFSKYSFVDNANGELVPMDKFNHSIDAIRYAEKIFKIACKS